jgi:NADH:ubiquinone oxidoreductase subunit 5 (subunit L)/multisubunit Na+/H+ antiporter MnhA subunit
MIMSIFVTFAALLIVFLIFAYFYDKNNRSDNGVIYVRMTAWILLFVLFFTFMTAGIDYKSGSTSIQTGNETITIIEEYDYENYTNRTFALFLCFMAGIGFITCFFDLRGGYHE